MKKLRWLKVFFMVILISFIFSPLLVGRDNVRAGQTKESYTPDWGSRTLSSTRVPELHEYYRTYSPHGLIFQAAWLTMVLFDETGQKYNIVREYKIDESTLMNASLLFQDLNKKAEPIFGPDELYKGRISHELIKEEGYILVRPFPEKNAEDLNIKIQPQKIIYKDAGGRVDLKFSAVAPALNFYCPGMLEDFFYMSEPHWVEGTLNGKPVKGLGLIDMAWGPGGVGFAQSKIYKLLEETWLVWLNVYEDGTKEGGVYITGVDQFEVCYYYKNGTARVTDRNQFNLALNEDGFPKSASFEMDDMKFQYTTEAWVMKAPTTWTAWASAKVINLKESRKPVQSLGVLEFFPKGLRK
jgi:hypothetical protein